LYVPNTHYDNERGFQWCNFLPALCVPTKLQGRLFPTVYVLGAGKSFSWSDCCHCGYVILLILKTKLSLQEVFIMGKPLADYVKLPELEEYKEWFKNLRIYIEKMAFFK